MSPAADGSVFLLHIFDAPNRAEAEGIDRWIVSAGLRPAPCEDVYLGLARAMKAAAHGICGVVVCVESLSAEEFEFFALLSRARREMPVLVYSERSPERVVRALQSGAKGLASEEAFAGLAARVGQGKPPKGPEPVTEFFFPAPGAAANEIRAAVARPTPPADPVEPEMRGKLPAVDLSQPDEELDVEVDADGSEGARVPWLRYQGGPTRQSPASVMGREASSHRSNGDTTSKDAQESVGARGEDSAPVPEGQSRVGPVARCEDEYEPLLTEEELAALLGDDLDDVGAQEREMLAGDEGRPGGGRRRDTR